MKKRHSDNPTPQRNALASTKADLREMRSNSSATVNEIREFLRELKGKSPQEMLGVVASNNLFRSLGLSSVIVAGVILLFTAIPFFFGKEKAPEVKSVQEQVTAPAKNEVTEPATAETPRTPDPLSALGVGEELTAPANKNPLESKGDDFLKDLE